MYPPEFLPNNVVVCFTAVYYLSARSFSLFKTFLKHEVVITAILLVFIVYEEHHFEEFGKCSIQCGCSIFSAFFKCSYLSVWRDLHILNWLIDPLVIPFSSKEGNPHTIMPHSLKGLWIWTCKQLQQYITVESWYVEMELFYILRMHNYIKLFLFILVCHGYLMEEINWFIGFGWCPEPYEH